MNNRKDGYYWVKFHGKWIICEWLNNFRWVMFGTRTSWFDKEFDQINEAPITEPE